jgi:4-hydroxybutyrate CoA-transferase
MQRLNDLSDIARRLPARPTLILHSGCSEPAALASRLAHAAASFDGAHLYCLMPMGQTPYANPPASGHLLVTTFFPGRGLREAITAGRAATLRYPLSEIPGLFDRRTLRADALLLQVSPPDAAGRVSLGLAVDYMRSVLRQKPLVIAQINPRLPRTCGDATFDAQQIDYFLEVSEPPHSVAPGVGDLTDQRIATHVATLIEDGAVLQVGIGSLPDQVLGLLGDRRNLGIHSGIITDAVRPLVESGAITNSHKRAFRGLSVTTMAAGTQGFYDWLDRNDAIEFHPCSVTHHAATLAEIEGFTAVNSALQIDLSGRVNAEIVGGRVVAAPGGLPDFARGARNAARGRSILAVRARFKDQSNLLGRLAPETPVSLQADDIDYVVTEFGIAALRGRSAIERAEALIAVAHPAHQAMLQRELSLEHRSFMPP